MSRSYKRHPISKDGGSRKKELKRFANKAVRNYEDMPSRSKKAYRKVSCSWNIADYVSRYTLEEAIEYYYKNNSKWFRKAYPTLEDYIQEWKKWYLRK